MKKINFLIASIFVLLLAVSTLAAIPTQINYQGILKSSSGTPISSSSLAMVFSIYAGVSGGAALWTETQNVTVEAGIYNVVLGKVTAIPSDTTVFDGSTRYLGIKVGSDAEMTPRLPLISVPYAYRAGTADSVTSSSGAVILGPAATQETSNSYGIQVTSTPVGGIGILGKASAATGSGVGIQGESNSSSGVGLVGIDYATSGLNYGVIGQSMSNIGRGVAGIGAVGVYGTTTYGGDNVAAVYGNIPHTGDYAGYGGIFTAHSQRGCAVFGQATATGAYTNYGGSFEACGDNGYGVVASNTHANGNTTGAALLIDGKIKANGPVGSVPTGLWVGAPWGSVITVNNPNVTANSLIFVFPDASGAGGAIPTAFVGPPGAGPNWWVMTKNAGVSFVLASGVAAETGSFNYLIIN